MGNVIWKPQPKQAVFMARPEYEALYGGAAGGGGVHGLIVFPTVLRFRNRLKESERIPP